ncbi:MAG: LysR family transcriptional regulator [Minwuia sp.]|uniref:LysR family transcriptional regulator n=1 Tax=Minwuia sp. TaxID=2493630 RepID=UPI003A8B94E8
MPVSPRRPRTPPLNALRAFEAAARLGSFAAAAEEISVTPGAVSQQIKSLETWAGAPLFRRRAQGVELTPEGRSMAPRLTAGFDNIFEAARIMRDRNRGPTLTVAALPSVAQLWLQPRLARVRGEMGGVMVSVYAVETPPDLRRNLFDLSIFIRPPRNRDPGRAIEDDEIFPVCTPALAERIRRHGGFEGMMLLVDESWADDWPLWADATGIALPDLQAAPRFSLYSMAIAEAKAGGGVAMGHRCLVAGDLASGALVRPFEATATTGKALVIEGPDVPTEPARQLMDLLARA